MSVIRPLKGSPARLEAWIFSNVTARDTFEVSPDDVGRFCLVDTPRGFYQLTSVAPVTWLPLAAIDFTESITVETTTTETSGPTNLIHGLFIIRPSSAVEGSGDDHPFIPIAVDLEALVPSSVDISLAGNSIYCIFAFTELDAPVVANALIGVRGMARVNGIDAHANVAIGVMGSIEAYRTDAVIEEARSLAATSPDFTDRTGTYLGGTIGIAYALYLASQESPYVTTPYGIYVLGEASENYIAGKLSIGANDAIRVEPDPTGTDDKIGVYRQPVTSRPTVTGSWADGTAGASLAAALATIGWIIDGTTA